MAKDRLDILRSYFSRRSDIKLAYLYGSQAGGAVGPMSDYDIAILPKGNFQPKQKYFIASEVKKLLKRQVDIVEFQKAPIELQFEIISHGCLIYSEDEFTRVEIEATTLSRYFDYLPILREQRRDLIKEVDHAIAVQRYRKVLGKTKKVLSKIRAASQQATR
jgi:uncharacterized protein